MLQFYYTHFFAALVDGNSILTLDGNQLSIVPDDNFNGEIIWDKSKPNGTPKRSQRAAQEGASRATSFEDRF